ncbi:hypothetical protein BLNAU_16414 [Blattamonas nauphoetae]|uniref:Rho-GAP domain-containing protein n=1 Tax=Blattamonas nauphoetae TaxID=2049346 RepID=A0ABQ9X8G1_9EUKA|nr:hypothetical protein BLNAU_16414 [Blattamonas nauphoetae]
MLPTLDSTIRVGVGQCLLSLDSFEDDPFVLIDASEFKSMEEAALRNSQTISDQKEEINRLTNTISALQRQKLEEKEKLMEEQEELNEKVRLMEMMLTKEREKRREAEENANREVETRNKGNTTPHSNRSTSLTLLKPIEQKYFSPTTSRLDRQEETLTETRPSPAHSRPEFKYGPNFVIHTGTARDHVERKIVIVGGVRQLECGYGRMTCYSKMNEAHEHNLIARHCWELFDKPPPWEMPDTLKAELPLFNLAMFGEWGVAKIAAENGKKKSDWASYAMRFQRDELDQSILEQTNHRCTDKATNILQRLFGMVLRWQGCVKGQMKERGMYGQHVLLAGQRGSDPVRDELYAMIVKQTNEFEFSASGSGAGEASTGKKGKKKEVWETMTDEERMAGWGLFAWMADTFLPSTAFQRGVLAYLHSRVEAGRAEGAGRAEKLAGVMASVVFSKMCVTLFFGPQRRAAEIAEKGPDESPTQLVEEGCYKKGKEHLLFVELVPNAGFEKIGSLGVVGAGGSGKEGKKEKKEEGERVVVWRWRGEMKLDGTLLLPRGLEMCGVGHSVRFFSVGVEEALLQQALFHSDPLTPPRWLSPLAASMRASRAFWSTGFVEGESKEAKRGERGAGWGSVWRPFASFQLPFVLPFLWNRFVELGGLETEGVFRRTVAESDISAAAALINAGLFWVLCGGNRKTRPHTDTSQPSTPQPFTNDKSKAKEKGKEKKKERDVSPEGMLVPSCLSFLAVPSADTLSDPLLFSGLILKWLEKLPTPIIPFSSHDFVIQKYNEIVEEEKRERTAWRVIENDPLVAAPPARVSFGLDVETALPPSRVLVLKYLFWKLRGLLAPEHAAKNRMSEGNLVTILAPSLLRRHDGTPLEQAQRLSGEIGVVGELFAGVGADATEAEEFKREDEKMGEMVQGWKTLLVRQE